MSYVVDNTHCSILVPAAGESKRFSDAGIHKPKGLIRSKWTLSKTAARYGTMIEHVVPIGWSGYIRVACKLDLYKMFKDALPVEYDVFPIATSQGQADTVVQACKDLRGNILVINSDNGFTHDLFSFVTHCRNANASCGAVVFKSEGESSRYGYINSFPHFEYGVEKIQISQWALAGAFYFKSANTLIDAAHAIFNDPVFRGIEGAEIYLSDFFHFTKGLKTAYAIPRNELHEWGTPAQLLKDKSLEIEQSDLA